MDENLRDLQRKALQTKDILDEVRYLTAYLRSNPEQGDVNAANDIIEEATRPCHFNGTAPEVTIAAVLASEKGCMHGVASKGQLCGSYCNTWSFVIATTTDNKFLCASESSDTTGHGCQCSGNFEVFDSIEALLATGLSDQAREILISR